MPSFVRRWVVLGCSLVMAGCSGAATSEPIPVVGEGVEARLNVTIDGAPYNVEIEHDHHGHDHAH